jgi:hypothetical protein
VLTVVDAIAHLGVVVFLTMVIQATAVLGVDRVSDLAQQHVRFSAGQVARLVQGQDVLDNLLEHLVGILIVYSKL